MKLPTLETMTDNILSVYAQAMRVERQEGREWYRKANAITRELAEKHDRPIAEVAGIISILSPSNRWDRNVEDADTLLTAHAAGLGPDEFRVSTYAANRRKAWWMLEEKSTPEEMFGKRAPKTCAFFRLIALPSSPDVVIDGHAFSIAIGVRTVLQSDEIPNLEYKGRYERISSAYREAALRLGLRASEVQAVTWLVWRRLHLSETRWEV
jgi:hypothetical protein